MVVAGCRVQEGGRQVGGGGVGGQKDRNGWVPQLLTLQS